MNTYGVQETNSLGLDMTAAQNYHASYHEGPLVAWNDPNLEKIERLRLLSDPGYSWYDVSYCYGRLKDGRKCRVGLPFSQLQKGRINVDIIKYAKADKVFASGLGVFDAISILN